MVDEERDGRGTRGPSPLSTGDWPGRNRPKMAGKTHRLEQTTLLTADGRAVPAGHPGGIVYLGRAGTAIPLERAEALGLIPAPDDPPPVEASKGAPRKRTAKKET
jgi:hypothetical protein